VAAGKDIDPRFNAAFQRGGLPAHPDVHVAARNVDALREASSPAAPAPAPRPKQTPPTTVGVKDSAGQAADDGRPVAGAPQEDAAPQSHYVDDSGALAGSASDARRRSLARNPWIYVLWGVGISATASGVLGQIWSYLQFFTQAGLDVADYRFITAVQGLAPISATVGAFFIVGALIVHAFNWMRRNP
jgi:hypothetical protein